MGRGDRLQRREGRASARGEFEEWAPELRALITDGETDPVLRMIYTLPGGHRWSRVPGVLRLSGTRRMNPPDGEGANLAMYDGSELGEAIAKRCDDLGGALAEYEEAMFVRGAKAAPEAAATFELCFGETAPYGLIAMFTGGGSSTGG
jgi:hypothetical protein